MTQNVVTVNGVELASTLSQPTHINIHIHQESALTHLLKAGSSLKQFLASLRNRAQPKARLSYGQLAGGVTQLLLGTVSCALGVLLYFGPWTELRNWGCAFWAGSVAIAAGAGAIVHEKRGSARSGWVSGLLALAGTVTALVAVVLCVNSITWENNGIEDSVCDHPVPPTDISGYQWGQRSRYYDSEQQENKCRSFMQILRGLFLGTRILLLAVCALQAIASLVSLGLCLRSWRDQSSQPTDERESGKKLLTEN